MEPQQTPHSQRDGEKEKQSWGHHNSGLQALLQSCNHQDSVVLAQKQTHRSVEQNRKPRKDLHKYSQLIFDKGAKEIQKSKESLLNEWCWNN